jgi:hypothetical protein
LDVTDYRKLFDLNDKAAVVLGAASGIGRSSAEALVVTQRAQPMSRHLPTIVAGLESMGPPTGLTQLGR